MLSDNDSRWDMAVRRLGDPLILLGHEGAAAGEASLLSHPRWRCVYFDAIASVFVPRSGESSAHKHTDLDTGCAEEALAAIGESLKRTLTASERRALIGIEALLNRSRPRSQ
jgi:hypothetical protein